VLDHGGDMWIEPAAGARFSILATNAEDIHPPSAFPSSEMKKFYSDR
jgi:hypothetical protein